MVDCTTDFFELVQAPRSYGQFWVRILTKAPFLGDYWSDLPEIWTVMIIQNCITPLRALDSAVKEIRSASNTFMCFYAQWACNIVTDNYLQKNMSLV